MRDVKFLGLSALAALGILLSSCTQPQSVVRSDAALGTVLYSDTEYNALKARAVTIDELAQGLTSPQSVKLLPGTKVEVTDNAQIPVASDVKAPVSWPFVRVHVLSGAASGRDGWIANVWLLDSKPVLVPAT